MVSATALKFIGMLHITMKQIAIQNGVARLIFARSTELWIFPWQAWTRSEERRYRSNSLRIWLIGPTECGEMIHSTTKQIAIQNGCALLFCKHGSLKFPWNCLWYAWTRKIIHFRKCEKITLRPEIWWHDAMYHEADHYLKWPGSAKVLVFWYRPTKGAVVLWMSCVALC